MQAINQKIIAHDVTHRLSKSLFGPTKREIDSKHVQSLTLAKNKYREPEMQLNPCLICLLSVEQMRDETTGKKWNHMAMLAVSACFTRSKA